VEGVRWKRQHYTASDKLIVCPHIFTSSYSFWPLSRVVVLKPSCIHEPGDGVRVKKQSIKVSSIVWEAKGPLSRLKVRLLF